MLIILIGILCVAMGVCFWLWVELKKDSLLVPQQPVANDVDSGSLPSDQEIKGEQVVLQEQVCRLKEELLLAQMQGQSRGEAETNEMIDLRRENQSLKLKLDELSAAPDDAALLRCRAENESFRVKMESFSGDLRQKMEIIESLTAEVGRLKADLSAAGVLQGVLEASRDDGLRKMHAMSIELEQLQIDNGRFKELSVPGSGVVPVKQEAEASLEKIQELEMVNSVQLQKNEYLQNELTKMRAYTAGLERLRENADQQSLTLGTDKQRAG